MIPSVPTFATGSQSISTPPSTFAMGPQNRHDRLSFVPQPSSFMTGNPAEGMMQGAALDPNSPELFRQNIRIALVEVGKLQMYARTVLSRIQTAYHPDTAPSHTQADTTRLLAQLESTIEMLRYTGVGALPVVPSATKQVQTEQELLANTAKSLQVLYDKVQRSQDGAAVVGNLLGLGSEKEGGMGGVAPALSGRTASESFRKTG